MFGDACNKADIDFVPGALADMFDHRLRMLERAPLQAHGHPDVAMSSSLGDAKRDERLALVIRFSEKVVMEKPPAL